MQKRLDLPLCRVPTRPFLPIGGGINDPKLYKGGPYALFLSILLVHFFVHFFVALGRIECFGNKKIIKPLY